ncbi:ADP-ribosylglycohydrolase family protein [Planctomycetota bacterium]
MKENTLSRRQFSQGAVGAVAAGMLVSMDHSSSAVAAAGKASDLRDKIFGCIAGSRMGSAFGAPVEGWSVEKIKAKYGVLNEFVSYGHYKKDWTRTPGTTEDGIERQKLMVLAIIEKQDSITVEDLTRKWVEILDVELMEYVTEGFDRKLVQEARAGKTPAGTLGSLVPNHINTLARSFHAIPIINACDIDGVTRDVRDVGRAYTPADSLAFPWGIAYNSGVVHAMRPDATVESVIETVRRHGNDAIRKELDHVLGIAANYKDSLEMRDEINDMYANESSPYCVTKIMKSYGIASIMETVGRALAIFLVTKGNVKEGVIAGANFGRDADCLAATVGGLSGALTGSATIPAEWTELVDTATANMPYTCSKMTLQETTDGMVGALKAKIKKMRKHVDYMETQFSS